MTAMQFEVIRMLLSSIFETLDVLTRFLINRLGTEKDVYYYLGGRK